MKTLIRIALMLVLLPTAFAQQEIDERAPMDENGTLEVTNVAGMVEVTGWDRDEVWVTGELGEGTERLDFEAEGDYTRIEVVLPKRGRGHREIRDSNLNVRVPRSARVQVTTVSADIIVEEARGTQRLQSVSGDIETTLWDEDAEIKTVSGDVEIDGHDEPASLTVTTVSGEARVMNVAGELLGSVVSGDLQVAADELERARLSAVSGDLDLRARMAEDARFDLEAISGDVYMSFKGDVDAEFDLKTFSGDIDNCFGHAPRRTSKYGPGWQLRFTEGDGNGRVTVNTMSGDVECSSGD